MPDLSSKLNRLNTALHILSTTDDEGELLERILDVVERVFGRETAAVLLRDPGGDRLTIVASRGYDPEVVAAYHARVGEGVAGAVAASGLPRLIPDVSKEPSYVAGVRSAVSEMAVPLMVNGEVIGVLDVEARQSAFGEEDMSLLVVFGEQAAWALRHSRALAESRERARRMELLNRAARELNAEHDPEELLGRILELAEEALGFHNVAVLVADRERRHLVVHKALRPGLPEGLKLAVDQGVSGSVFTSGHAEIVADVTADPRYIAGGLEGARCEMAAPLNLDHEIIGVLDAESQQAGAFGPLDLQVFSAFAAQVATALRNAELMRDLEARARRLHHITCTGRALNTILDVDDLLAEILRGADEALGLGRAALLLVDGSELVLRAARGYGPVTGKRIPIGQGVTGHVARRGEPLLVRDVTADPRYVPGIQGGASEMAVPLRLYGRVLGVLDTESPEPDAFSEQDLDLFCAFADQAAVALHNAQLFNRLEAANQRLRANVEEVSRLNQDLEAYARQISAANANLEVQIRQLTALHQAGQVITSSLDLKATLNAILTMTSEIVHSSAGAIKLMDAETKELRVAAQAGIFDDAEGPVRKLDMPLRIGSRTIGVFELFPGVDARIDEGGRKMLETLASQAAIAIENARLFEDTQRTYYETLKSLAKALEARDDYTRGHSERVASLALAIAHQLDLDEEHCNLIYNGALLHDIGKIGVPDAILLKPQGLSAEEMEIIRKHPTFGIAILGPLKFLGKVSELVMRHHERWDGSGYPSGLRGQEIPLASRIIAVADAYDAMTSSRPYRGALSHEEAVAEIKRGIGQQHDPAVVDAFLSVIERRRLACTS